MKKQKGKTGRIVNIEDWSFERFKKLLIEAEHCDTMRLKYIQSAARQGFPAGTSSDQPGR